MWVCISVMHVFFIWNTSLDKIESFEGKENNCHSTIKFTAELETAITFLGTKVYKGVKFKIESPPYFFGPFPSPLFFSAPL